jgi:hypothetical protein
VISAAVEGLVDEAVVRRLVTDLDSSVSAVYGRQGKAWLRQRMQAYAQAARNSPWLILVDLDDDKACAPDLLAEWIPSPPARLLFRVAVREVESWLMADTEQLASFLGISRRKVPHDVEGIRDPKRIMVQLAASSSKRFIREDMSPPPGSKRSTGPAYTSRLIEYTQDHWRPSRASDNSDSLRRAVERLRRLVRFSE